MKKSELLKNGDVFMQFVQEYVEHNNRNRDKSIPANIDEDPNRSKAKTLLKQISETGDAVEEFTEFVLSSPPIRFTPPQLIIEESKTKEQVLSTSPTRSNDGFSPIHSKFSELSNIELLPEEAIQPRLVNNRLNRIVSRETSCSESVCESDKNPLVQPIGQLIDEELAMSGTVKWRTYGSYIISRGLLLYLTTSIIYATYIGLQVYNNVWLQQFTEDAQILNASAEILKNSSTIPAMSDIIRERTKYYMTRYSYIGLSMVFIVCIYWFSYTMGSVQASKIIHKTLLEGILRASMQFFDTTPSGRILNRFSKDIETIDHVLPMTISDTLSCFFGVLSSIAVIIYVTPWFAVIIIPLAIFYYFIQLFYMPSSRQARRLTSIATSPVFNNFAETLLGVAVIRAFSEQNYFRKLNQGLVDRSNKFKFIQNSSTRWLSFRIDTIGNMMVFAAVLFAIIDRGVLSIGLAGLSVTYSLQITDNLNWLLRQYTNLETNFVSMERIREYSMGWCGVANIFHYEFLNRNKTITDQFYSAQLERIQDALPKQQGEN